jgi:hypothetical protein
MEMMREAWTDQRLDDLNHRVDEGFGEMRQEFRALRGEMAAMRSDFNDQMAQLHRTTVQLFGGMLATMTIGFSGLIVAVLTQA